MFLLVFLALGISSAWAQKTFSGKVIGPDGLRLPGVSVLEKANPMNGVATDIDGNWTLTVPSGNSILEFTAIGMKPIEIATKDAGKLTMVIDATLIDEVIVLGYGSQNKSELTGSSVQVDSDELADLPVASVDQALQGKVAGVNIASTSGTPGSVQNIRIRGISSITAGNSPLYVVDGIPVNNSDIGNSGSTGASSLSELSSLNSSDIESITVLKDPSATATYGARGANGVIVITTKSGRKGKAKLEFKATLGFSNDAIDEPKVLTAAQREELTYEAVLNTYMVV
ncbi:TonB-dependent receptor plug domain-containing protein [Balneicella halophila]|uniref:TonB-dependent receptor plug domain-containing protein n=1 Tax=Balneicella halophila TaxID=1537566 RepID=UPI001A9C98DA|nr:TonB-dependent receptor plug domain-containing protein [Balneicella halophila]